MLDHCQVEQDINQSPHGATSHCEASPCLAWCCCPREMFWTPLNPLSECPTTARGCSCDVESQHPSLPTLRGDQEMAPEATTAQPQGCLPMQEMSRERWFSSWMLTASQKITSAWKGLLVKSISPGLDSRTARRMCPNRFGADKILFIFNC